MASEHVIAVDESNFQEVVLESKEPVLVDFWAEWCGPCKMLSPIIDEVAQENIGKVKICKLNVDNAQRISKRYGVMSIPTVMLFKNGEEVERAIGFRPKHDIVRIINLEFWTRQSPFLRKGLFSLVGDDGGCAGGA